MSHIDIDNSKLSIPEAMLLVNVKPHAVSRVAEELAGLEEVKELYVTSDSDAAIVSRVSGDMQRILSIQDQLNRCEQHPRNTCKKRIKKSDPAPGILKYRYNVRLL